MINEDYYIPSTYSAESKLHIKIKTNSSEYKNPIVLCHGRTLPTSLNWDFSFDGKSFADLAVESGLTVIMLDALGYGPSSKYKEMSFGPICDNHINTFNDFYRDIKDVLVWLNQTKHIIKPYLVGWSNSVFSAMMIAERDRELVTGVICYGMIKNIGDGKHKINLHVPNYEMFNVEDFTYARYKFIRNRFDILPLDWFHVWKNFLKEYKPIRLNGSFVDSHSIYNQTKQIKDWVNLEKIEIPILFLRGEFDIGSETNIKYFYDRVSSQRKNMIIIENATHFSCMETTRKDLLKLFLTFMELENE
jgi:pimeloyl-ACP methyl ester carboxylesterase